MMTRGLVYAVVATLCMGAGWAWAGNESGVNTWYGEGAGASLTTGGINNTFIGYYAGNSVTTQDANTFLGNNAGRNTTQSFNTFVGALSGFTNTSGGNNTFLGYAAGNLTTEGGHNTFLGNFAGYANTTGVYNIFAGSFAGQYNTTGGYNSFLGVGAGDQNTTGHDNTLLGYGAGYHNSTGNGNTFLGSYVGYNATGYANVFLGYQAGYNETGSQKLYIANSDTTSPLIYGEFNTHKLTINGNLQVIGPDNGLVRLSNVTTDSTTKVSRMVLNHYSNAALPVYLFGAASTSGANFVAFGGGATIGNAATQIDLYTAPNTTTPAGSPRLTIIGNGYVGIGTQSPTQPLQMAGGAYSNGTSWINASSREYKENIESLDSREALMTLASLDPVKFNYKSDTSEKHVGFIAEDVPQLVATKDRKGLSPMDIVAVLTKVVQEQRSTIGTLVDKLSRLEDEVNRLKSKDIAANAAGQE